MQICARWMLLGFLALLATAGNVLDLQAQVPASYEAAADTAASAEAAQILEATGVQGGLVVHLGCGDGRLTAALRVASRYQVHGLDRDLQNVRQARQYLLPRGYGDVAVDRLSGDQLPYIDNVVNLLVAEDLGDVSMDEVLRVLVPQGVAYVKQNGKWVTTIKPRPRNIDEWTHYLHDLTGNAVAHDTVVGPPRHLQWVGNPRWSRHHDRMASMSALVSAGGRIFYIMDEGSRVSIQLPPQWTLVARDAFNGMLLWKQPIARWHSHLWPLKSGPSQLARRLVATGDRVYVTLGIDAPLTELDAATGKLIREYPDTKATEEILVDGSAVYLLVNKGASELSEFAPQFNTGDQRRVGQEFSWNEQPRQLMAFDTQTGQLRWKKESKVAPLSLSGDAERLFFHDGERIVCLSRADGDQQWASPPVGRRPTIAFNFGPRVVIKDDVLLFAGGDRTMRAFDSASGKMLWSAPHAQSGYQSPEDLLVVGGLVWSAPTTSGRDSGVFTGRDLHTGEVKREFPPDVETYWFHHRCYISKATDRFLLPSRTGIEFVDPQQQSWKIHHWVRGGCLYGVMPCNGLLYAPPHDCACYPEAKLYGMNALAPAMSSRALPAEISEEGRLETGPAFRESVEGKTNEGDWPTYRGNIQRSGFTKTPVADPLQSAWETELGGLLSAVVVADGRLYVAQIDAHTVHALDAGSGQKVWSFTAGGRVDSPPTIDSGRAIFGSADGWVYCLRAADGELIWRFRAAPQDRRLVAFDQLESVWPVHGNVLVRNGIAYFVAGRSAFLDGGLRMFQLDLATGRKVSESVMNDVDPETGEDLQNRLQTLQMPVGLPDILSSDGPYIYMRSQPFDLEGNRLDLGPHSGQAAQQGATQRGNQVHLFSPTGFLDGTWFHRSYWVHGRSFAGGHNGYYQAGKYTPSGRILVFDDQHVYGFGRKPEYLKWTTTLEHQLFASSKEAPEVDPAEVGKAASGTGGSANMVQVGKSASLNPANTPLAVEAWIKAERPEGVILARGGPSVGFALVLSKGQPRFMVRNGERLSVAAGKKRVVGEWTHLVGMLTADKKLRLYVDGQLAAAAEADGLLASDPAQAMEIGADDKGAVGDYRSPLGFTGVIDEVNVYHGTLTPDEIAERFESPGPDKKQDPRRVLALSFDEGQATDASGKGNHGQIVGARPAPGKVGGGLRFSGGKGAAGNQAAGSLVRHDWNKDIPLLVRAMTLADGTLFVMGPPDTIDEEETFQRLASRDPKIGQQLAEQEAALRGGQGAVLQAIATRDGRMLAEYKLPSLPVWDGLIAAQGRLYFATEDGKVVCYAPSK